MAYQQDASIKIKHQRSKQAVALAMQGKWREAVAANKVILEAFPRDVEAFNRMGKAYIEMGEYTQAREAYQRSLAIDPFNNIARKNLDRILTLAEAPVKTEVGSAHAEPQIFIEEIGKAGVVELTAPAPRPVLAKVTAGDVVELKTDGNTLVVEGGGEYLGLVEPRHAQRLIRLTQGGNRYTAAIVSNSDDRVTVIIREVYQDPGQAGQLSFPPKGLKAARPHIVGRGARGEELEEEGPEEASGDTSETYYEDAGGRE